MNEKKQIIIILLLSTVLGITRYILIEDPDFTLIKKERVVAKVDSFIIQDDIAGPMVVDLEFSKYYFDHNSAIFIDARDPEDYNIAHIKNSINIPYDYFEDYEDVIDSLDESAVYIIYCSGGECSLSIDLADYLYNEKLFDQVLVFEGGSPEWEEAGYP